MTCALSRENQPEAAEALPTVQVENERMQYFSTIYNTWRQGMTRRNMVMWQDSTALSRQRQVRNQAVSEKKKWPEALFKTPVNMPSLTGLKHVTTRIKGKTAASVWFGKIDFGVGGNPTDNVLVLNFLFEDNRWKFDAARFYNLEQMPELRKSLAAGDRSVVSKHDGLLPTGEVPAIPPLCPEPKYIAKVFADCQGREVEVLVNGISSHKFGDTREAEIISGGLQDGKQTIRFRVKDIPELAKGYLTVAVYLMPEVEGQVPGKAYFYTVPASKPMPVGEQNAEFVVDEALLRTMKRPPGAQPPAGR